MRSLKRRKRNFCGINLNILSFFCRFISKKPVVISISILLIYFTLVAVIPLFQVSYGKTLQKDDVRDLKRTASNDHIRFPEHFAEIARTSAKKNVAVPVNSYDHIFQNEQEGNSKKRNSNPKDNFNENLNLLSPRSEKLKSVDAEIENQKRRTSERHQVDENFTNLTNHENNSNWQFPSRARRRLEEFERRKLIKEAELSLKLIQNSSFFQENIQELPLQKKGIVILTNYRSGSTFLGELFNQHPDAFYIFEPLLPLGSNCGEYKELKISTLRQFLKCDFPSMVELYPKVNGPLLNSVVDKRCLFDNFCFRMKTKDLCHRSLCFYPSVRLCRDCGPIHPMKSMNVCRSKKMSVIKVIRFCDVLDLKSILLEPDTDFKVIHLVRDPRGLENSRNRLHPDWSIMDNAKTTCERLFHNSLRNLPKNFEKDWLKNRYMQVRYEDLSLDTVSVAKKVFEFAGLEYVPDIDQWIHRNTQSNSLLKHPFSTRRNSTVVMQEWRRYLSLEQVLKIQEVCSKTMSALGYKLVSNDAELKNMDLRLF